MAAFQWNDNLSVGVAEIDEQHRRLIELVNAFYEGVMDQRPKEALGQLLEGMAEYTRYHFALEEHLMAEHGYPGLEEQRAQHDAFVRRTADMIRRHISGGLVISLEATRFLREWLTEHIGGSDKELGRFLNARGVR